MLVHAVGGTTVQFHQIQIFVDRGDVDPCGAGETVVAVHTTSLNVCAEHTERGENSAVIPFFFGEIPVCHGTFHVADPLHAHHDCRYGGTAECIADALCFGQRNAERGTFAAQQCPHCQRFHDRDRDAVFLAGTVECRTGGFEGEFREILLRSGEDFGENFGHIPVFGDEIVCGIKGEHENVNESAFNRFFGSDGVMGTHADRADDPFFLQREGIPHHVALFQRVPVGFPIDKMQHADVDVVGLQTFEQVFEICNAFADVAADLVLSVHPAGANVSLDDDVFAASAERFADVGTHIGFAHEDVEKVDSRVQRGVDDGFYKFIVLPLHVFAAEGDLADGHAGSA